MVRDTAPYQKSWLDLKSSTTPPVFDAMASKPRKELSQWDKGRIEGRSLSMTDTEIGRELHIPQRTVSNFLTRLKNQHSSKNLPRHGRPRITTKAQDKRIITAAETNTRVPFASLQNLVNVPASTFTI